MPRRRKRNRERTWFAILREIARKESEAAAWLYATALRGPDSHGVPWCVKAIFTGPLRGYEDSLAVADVSAYHWCIKRPDNVLKAFRYLVKDRNLDHYLKHLISAWEVLEPSVAEVLAEVLEAKMWGKTPKLDGISIRYTRAVARWLRRTSVLPEREDKDA